jgi:5-methylcytosine-specific restriction endonuclease McrA
MRIHRKVEVECKDCHMRWQKRPDSPWKGRCRTCSNIEVGNRPYIKEFRRKVGVALMARVGKLPVPKLENRKRGPDHYNWRGGVTPEHLLIRWSPRMREWSKTILQRDGYKCVICGERSQKLHADHIKPFSIFHDLRFDLDNGRTLCQPCHKAFGAKVFHGKLTRAAIHPPSWTVTGK